MNNILITMITRSDQSSEILAKNGVTTWWTQCFGVTNLVKIYLHVLSKLSFLSYVGYK